MLFVDTVGFSGCGVVKRSDCPTLPKICVLAFQQHNLEPSWLAGVLSWLDRLDRPESRPTSCLEQS